MEHRVRAHNTSTASTNRIHSDEVARQYGFRGGLVAGVDVYAYLCHLPVARWGVEWLQRGTMTARFVTPVYDGEEVRIEGTSDDNDDGRLDLVLTDPSGARCAEGHATLPPSPPEAVDVADWPTGEPPDTPPPVTAERLTSRPLGRLEATFHADRSGEYLDDVREDLALFRDGGVAHPGWLLRYANYVLTANVRLGPWIHVASAVQFHSPVVDGETVATRAVVTDVHERKGHRFVDLDVLQAVGTRPVARIAHTAIYEPRRP